MKLTPILTGLSACLMAAAAHAQSVDKYPERPIKIIIPYQAGGGTDVMTRIIVEKVRERTKQP